MAAVGWGWRGVGAGGERGENERRRWLERLSAISIRISSRGRRAATCCSHASERHFVTRPSRGEFNQPKWQIEPLALGRPPPRRARTGRDGTGRARFRRTSSPAECTERREATGGGGGGSSSSAANRSACFVSGPAGCASRPVVCLRRRPLGGPKVATPSA